ncbi:MAG: hypothetical protein QOF21_688 [Actinomycetota bacterium]|jgi:hypothetical protein
MRRSAVFALALVLLLAGACSSDKKPEANGEDAPPTTADNGLRVFKDAPPWPLADRQADRIAEAGLPLLTAEGSIVHFHAHLDVFDNGERVTIPAGVGIDFERRVISPLHTHFDTGVLHVEAEADEPVTLGQFLMQWGVRVEGDCIGNVCAPDPIAAYVNGVKQPGPVTEIVIKADLEIALILGTPPPTIPKGYTCVNPSDACPKTPAP